MLRNIFGFVLLALCLVGLEHYRSLQLQSRRNAEQAQLLDKLASLNYPAVSRLVEDWRLAYPEPNEDRLDELRDLAAQLGTDPAALDRRQVPKADGTE